MNKIDSSITSSLGCAIVSHHFRIFGLNDRGIGSSTTEEKLSIYYKPAIEEAKKAALFLEEEKIVVAIKPTKRFCDYFNIALEECSNNSSTYLSYVTYESETTSKPWHKLKTLYTPISFGHPNGITFVQDASKNKSILLWIPYKKGGLLLIGNDLPKDLIRFRQGDPMAAQTKINQKLWGFDTERPVYLFDSQLQGDRPEERWADWWIKAIFDILEKTINIRPLPLLPGNKVGAVIITGDDDQAFLEKYDKQVKFFKELPITYFLHPLTRHTKKSLQQIKKYADVDLGIHPDALENPKKYSRFLVNQVSWYRHLVKSSPLSIRNHGFLNDGYWAHLPSWLEHEIKISSNLPGVNGRVLNGSLLPSRVFYNSILTTHWSLLTAIGDGVISTLGYSCDQAAQCIYNLADQIKNSGVPGVIVLNLHPQNIDETISMHIAVKELVTQGFHPWNIKDCYEWFTQRDHGIGKPPEKNTNNLFLARLFSR